MRPTRAWEPDFSKDYVSGIKSYKDEILRSYPEIPREVVNGWSLFTTDALALGYFLDRMQRRVFVFEVGTFFGVSTFFFASHANVSKVVSIDPNPRIADQLTANSDRWESEAALENLHHIGVLDVARSTLAKFDAGKKVELLEGVVGSSNTGVRRGPAGNVNELEVPVAPEDEVPVAFVDGLHTKEGAREDLRAIFERNPESIVFLDDCRRAWGPFVQAGVVDFMAGREEGYEFRLLGDLSPSLASSNVGIVYPPSVGQEVDKALNFLRKAFSERLDTLRLLSREADLIAEVNRLREDLATREEKLVAQKEDLATQKEELVAQEKELVAQEKELIAHKSRASHLERKAANLERYISEIESRRIYKAADRAAKGLLRVPGTKGLLRSRRPKP